MKNNDFQMRLDVTESFWYKQKIIQDEINIQKNHYVLINKL